jgi:hypothetical protein
VCSGNQGEEGEVMGKSSHLLACPKFPAIIRYSIKFIGEPKCMCRDCMASAIGCFKRWLRRELRAKKSGA